MESYEIFAFEEYIKNFNRNDMWYNVSKYKLLNWNIIKRYLDKPLAWKNILPSNYDVSINLYKYIINNYSEFSKLINNIDAEITILFLLSQYYLKYEDYINTSGTIPWSRNNFLMNSNLTLDKLALMNFTNNDYFYLTFNKNITCRYIHIYQQFPWDPTETNIKNLVRLIKKYGSKVKIDNPYHWVELSHNLEISLNFIFDNLDKPWDWYYISKRDDVTFEIIEKNKHLPWNYYSFLINKNCTYDNIKDMNFEEDKYILYRPYKTVESFKLWYSYRVLRRVLLKVWKEYRYSPTHNLVKEEFLKIDNYKIIYM